MSLASAAFEPLPDAVADDLLQYLDDRYGFARTVFAGHRFWHRPGSPAVWIAAADVVPPPVREVAALGLCAFRDPPPRGKPSNVFFQRFGAAATRMVCELPATASAPFLSGAPLEVADRTTRGWVLVRTGGRVLGRAWLEGGLLKGELKHAWRRGLEAPAATEPPPTS